MSRSALALVSLVVLGACSGDSTSPTPGDGVATVTVTPTSASVVQGGTQALTAVLRDGAGQVLTGKTVTWFSATPTIASVSNAGVVTGVNPGGPVTITASSEGRSGSTEISVTQPVVASIDLTPASVTLAVGATRQLVATPKNAAGQSVPVNVNTWSTNNAFVASVSSSGVVTAVAVGGPVTITAFAGNVSASATITVTGP